MTQFDDCLDPIIRPCGTSIVSRGWYGRQSAAVRFRRAEDCTSYLQSANGAGGASEIEGKVANGSGERAGSE